MTGVLTGSGGISSTMKLGAGRYRFYFAAPKSAYVVSGSSEYNGTWNTWICGITKSSAYVDVSTCDAIPTLTFVDTPSLDILVLGF